MDSLKIVEEIESLYPLGVETWYRESVTGEEYKTFKNDGIYAEGRCPVLEDLPKSPDEAWDKFYENFIAICCLHKKEDGYKLYWRIVPTDIRVNINDETELSKKDIRFYVRCRFLISNKPEIPERVACAPHYPKEKDDS